jgi:hypothetical protein
MTGSPLFAIAFSVDLLDALHLGLALVVVLQRLVRLRQQALLLSWILRGRPESLAKLAALLPLPLDVPEDVRDEREAEECQLDRPQEAQERRPEAPDGGASGGQRPPRRHGDAARLLGPGPDLAAAAAVPAAAPAAASRPVTAPVSSTIRCASRSVACLTPGGDDLRRSAPDRRGKLPARRALLSPHGMRDGMQRVALEDVQRLPRLAAADLPDLRLALCPVDDLVVGPSDLLGGALLQVEELLLLDDRRPDRFVVPPVRLRPGRSRPPLAEARPPATRRAARPPAHAGWPGPPSPGLPLALDLQDPQTGGLLAEQLPEPLAIGGVGGRLAELLGPLGESPERASEAALDRRGPSRLHQRLADVQPAQEAEDAVQLGGGDGPLLNPVGQPREQAHDVRRRLQHPVEEGEQDAEGIEGARLAQRRPKLLKGADNSRRLFADRA